LSLFDPWGEVYCVFLWFSKGGVWETMPELGDSVFTSCVHLFTIKFVKGAVLRPVIFFFYF
jgi:hypothetical protein